MFKINFTTFDTVKGEFFKEISINKFFKRIEKKINKYSKYCKHKDIDMDVCYGANVYKLDDTSYEVSFLNWYNNESRSYTDYVIDADKYPQYAKVLDKYAEITSRHVYEKECYKKLENNEIGTTEENTMYLNYLKKLKKCSSKLLLNKILVILALPISTVFLALSVYYGMSFSVGIFTLLGIHTGIQFGRVLLGRYSSDKEAYNTYTDSLIEASSKNRMFGRRIKQLTDKLGVRQEIYNENNVTVSKEDMYRDGVINYMNNIMTAANGLNSDDRKRVLYDLKAILDEYTTKCQAANNGDGMGLSLDGGKRQVVKETIEKLTSLQMELADLIKRDSKNKTLLVENEKFRQAIDESIESVEEGKKLTLARGK